MKKVLVITYYWPPAGGPGVQRWLHFARHLPEFGVEPLIYSPENPKYPIEDNSLLKEIPSGLRHFTLPIQEPLKWLPQKKIRSISSGLISSEKPGWVEKLLLWVRGNFFIPDARVLWVRPSVRYLSNLLQKEGIDTVITTGPPHSLHLIGMKLKEIRGIHWIADFRDPWTSIGYHKKLRLGKRASARHKALEKMVVGRADHILTTSESTAAEFRQLSTKPISVITNGYADHLTSEAAASLDKTFTLSHIGSLLTGRDPANLWKILGQLVSENEEFAKNFRLQLIGTVSQDVIDNIRAQGLDANLRLVPYVSHSKAIAFQRKSQLLLLIEIDSEETRGIIPGKVFEYMAARRPALAVGPEKWEAGKLIEETGCGHFFGYGDEKGLKTVLQSWFEDYSQGGVAGHEADISRYSRRQLTRRLVKTLQWE